MGTPRPRAVCLTRAPVPRGVHLHLYHGDRDVVVAPQHGAILGFIRVLSEGVHVRDVLGRVALSQRLAVGIIDPPLVVEGCHHRMPHTTVVHLPTQHNRSKNRPLC